MSPNVVFAASKCSALIPIARNTCISLAKHKLGRNLSRKKPGPKPKLKDGSTENVLWTEGEIRK
jgi:hypothetical protein